MRRFMTNNIGSRLKSAREKKGLRRDQVAERLGLSLSTIQAYENNRNQLKPDGLETFSRLYGVSIEWLVTGKEAQSAEIVSIWSRIKDRDERDAWLNMGKTLAKDAD